MQQPPRTFSSACSKASKPAGLRRVDGQGARTGAGGAAPAVSSQHPQSRAPTNFGSLGSLLHRREDQVRVGGRERLAVQARVLEDCGRGESWRERRCGAGSGDRLQAAAPPALPHSWRTSGARGQTRGRRPRPASRSGQTRRAARPAGSGGGCGGGVAAAAVGGAAVNRPTAEATGRPRPDAGRPCAPCGRAAGGGSREASRALTMVVGVGCGGSLEWRVRKVLRSGPSGPECRGPAAVFPALPTQPNFLSFCL